MIQSLYERVRDSLFALPLVLIALLGGMSWVGRIIDERLAVPTWGLLPTTADSTRWILSTIAGATITVAGIVFSMTAVVVQLATSQLSPRVTQGFLRDRYQQLTIGMTVGTFVYALLILSDVHGTEELPFSRHDFSVTLAIAFGVVSMILIVFFIDRIMRSMRIDTLIRRLADQTIEAVHDLPDWDLPSASDRPLPDDEPGCTMEVSRTGWVAGIDLERIIRAIPEDCVVRIDLRVGDFIIEREVAARSWPELSEAAQSEIASSVSVSRTRSISNDPAYGIRQLVDVGLRALSSAINDPTTASDVIRHLGGPLQAVLLRDLPGRVFAGEGGRRIYLPRGLNHSEYVHLAFREIRLNSDGEPYALFALIETLASLIVIAKSNGHGGRATALHREAAMTLEMIEKSSLPEADKESLLDFARRVGPAGTSPVSSSSD